MAPTVREVLSASVSSDSVTVITGEGTQAGDVLVCIYGCNWFSLADMGVPYGTAGEWALAVTADAGQDSAHIKAFIREVTAGGAQTVTVPQVLDSEVYQILYVLADADPDIDPAACAGDASAAATTTCIAPSVIAQGDDDLLICAWQGQGQGTPETYSTPTGMTGMVQQSAAWWATLASAREALTAPGATGTRVSTSDTSKPYAAVSIAVRSPVSGVTGTVSGTLPALTGSVSATVADSGSVSGALPSMGGALTATVTATADLSGTLPALTGTLSGDVQDQGAIAGALPALGGSVSGEVFDDATLTGSLPAMTGDVSATVISPGTLDTALPTLTGDLAGTVTNLATLAGTLPALTGSLPSSTPDEATLAGALPVMTGSLTGEVVAGATLAGTLPALTGSFTGGVPGVVRTIRVTVNGAGLSKSVTGPASVAEPAVSGPDVRLEVTGPAVRRTVTGIGV